jgi:hypothetical protein
LALEKETDADLRAELAIKLAAVASRMHSPEANRVWVQATNALTRVWEKTTVDGYYRSRLPGKLGEVVGRMEAPEVVRLLRLLLEKETDAHTIRSLSSVLAEQVGRLTREEAITVSQPVIQKLVHAIETEKDESERQTLAAAVAGLLSASEYMYARRISAKVAFVVCSSREAILGIDDLDALLTDHSQSDVSSRAVTVATAVGMVRATPFFALQALSAVSEPLPCRLSTQDLVELLKMPTCFGEARKVVLKHLGNRYGRRFANHWEFVRFTKEQHLDLDLTSPPKRPARP